jgi:hypothetical protein
MSTRINNLQSLTKTKGTISASVMVFVYKEEDIFVSYCPALELSSYGKSIKAAKTAFNEAMDIFLSETTRKGTLEKLLLDYGWQLRKKPVPSYTPPSLDKIPQRLFNSKNSILKEQVSFPV